MKKAAKKAVKSAAPAFRKKATADNGGGIMKASKAYAEEAKRKKAKSFGASLMLGQPHRRVIG